MAFKLETIDQGIKLARAIKPALVAMDVHDLASHRFKQRDPLLTPWLNSQDLAMIFAGRGIGKTHLAFAVSLAS